MFQKIILINLFNKIADETDQRRRNKNVCCIMFRIYFRAQK